jgi:acyl carrier protein
MSKATVTEAEALALLAEAFAEPVENLQPSTARDDIAGWDSMGAMVFMAELDEKFGVELTADVSKKMLRIEDALAFMRSHGIIAPQ